jgi:hypothetical protein
MEHKPAAGPLFTRRHALLGLAAYLAVVAIVASVFLH